MTTNCSSCRFYNGTSIGACHRYPSPTRVQSIHWCGEYAAVDLPKVEPVAAKKKSGGRLNFRPLTTPEDGNKL